MTHQNSPNTLNFINYYIVMPIVTILGCFLNIITFLIYNHSSFSKENVYVFLKYESLFITIDLFINSLGFLHMCPGTKNMFATQVFYVYMLIITTSFFELSAIICHIISTWDMVLLITNKSRPKMCPI